MQTKLELITRRAGENTRKSPKKTSGNWQEDSGGRSTDPNQCCGPKDEKSLGALGIPAVEDKVVQMGIKKILEAICEQDFVEVSYGFRPNRSCHVMP